MALKVLSMNFIREGEIPARTRETENSKVYEQLIEQFKKVPQGSGLRFKVEKFKKHQRYQIQKALQNRGLKVIVVQIDDSTLAIQRAKED